jgi:salicylate hydroxylase
MPSTTLSLSPVEPQTFHVAIIGGGIGGLTTALSLAHQNPGLNITVFEQAPAYREIGAGIGIGVNAAKILHRLGVGKAANAISGERNGMHRSMRRWDNGGEIVTVESMDGEGETRQLSVHRAELLDVLYRSIQERGIARLHTNKKAVRVEACCTPYLTFGEGVD